MAIHSGADEIDIVISVGKFLSSDYEGMGDEIEELKEEKAAAGFEDSDEDKDEFDSNKEDI